MGAKEVPVNQEAGKCRSPWHDGGRVLQEAHGAKVRVPTCSGGPPPAGHVTALAPGGAALLHASEGGQEMQVAHGAGNE